MLRLNTRGVALWYYCIIVHEAYKQAKPPIRILHMFLSTLYISVQLESGSSRFREWCTMNNSPSIEEFLQHMSMLHIISCYVPWYSFSAQTTERDTRVPSSSIWKRPLSTSPPSCVRSPGNLERSAQREQPFCALLYLRSSASCCDAIWTERKLACA